MNVDERWSLRIFNVSVFVTLESGSRKRVRIDTFDSSISASSTLHSNNADKFLQQSSFLADFFLSTIHPLYREPLDPHDCSQLTHLPRIKSKCLHRYFKKERRQKMEKRVYMTKRDSRKGQILTDTSTSRKVDARQIPSRHETSTIWGNP